MIPDDQKRGAPGLLSDALMQLTRIIRGEITLAQTEMAASLRGAVMGVAVLMVAAVLAITALNLISAALVGWVIYLGVSPAWATVIVGAAFAILAVIAALSGLAALKPAKLVPERALRGLRQDVETVKEGLTP